MLDTINRDALIITPKKELIDWVNYIFDDGNPVPIISPNEHDQSNIYLVPEYDNPTDTIEYLKKNIKHYLKNELIDWCEDESLWPKKLDWELFEKWFRYSIQSVVIDMGQGEINTKKY